MYKDPALAQLFYQEIKKIHRENVSLEEKVVELDSLLRKLFFELTKQEKIAFTTIFSRIAFIAQKFQLSRAIQWRIHRLERRRKDILLNGLKLTESKYFGCLKTTTFAIKALCKGSIDPELQSWLPEQDEAELETKKIQVKKRLDQLRVVVLGVDKNKECLICKMEDNPVDSIYVKYNELAVNDSYNLVIEQMEEVFDYKLNLNLLDVLVDEQGIYIPKAFIIEPDYLMDISAIAECFQPTETIADLYLLKKFIPFKYSVPLMLGNVANFFLDELMTDIEVDFNELFPKVFALNPLAFATFNDADVREVFQKSKRHFSHLKQVIKHQLRAQNISPEKCYLEPSFYSERYGIQGRLDVWHRSTEDKNAAIIELKSGRPFMANKHGLSQNHYTQTLLYDLLVQSVYPELTSHKYILYSALAVESLKYAPSYKTLQDEALLVRNALVALEFRLSKIDDYNLQNHCFLDQLNPNTYSQVRGFNAKNIQYFAEALSQASPLERSYFLAYVAFTAREHQLAKTGVQGNDKLNGLASLWMNDYEDKNQAFEVLGHLEVIGNAAAEEERSLLFRRTAKTNPLANFRQGDIVVLYPVNKGGDNALNSQIFKGSIIALSETEVELRLHYKQFNGDIFQGDTIWNIEKDMMDKGYTQQYLALCTFLKSTESKRRLLLTQRAPEQQRIKQFEFFNPGLSQEQYKILCKALSAKDYFLLVGPPGTGKTKFMLSEMVHYLLKKTSENILLLAYTNRAVDEICEAIHDFASEDYLRIGSRYSSDEAYVDRLFSVQTEKLATRKALQAIIQKNRIFVSTVASISSRSTLLNLKQFDTVIIDEASQILEPVLMGLLPSFKRFILIGDHKQLPAVVLQDKERSAIDDPLLNSIGLVNRRNSLFERLYTKAKENRWDWAYDMLSHQGRMHGDISRFPSKEFYEGELMLLPEELSAGIWQREALTYDVAACKNDLQEMLAKNRMLYFNTATDRFNNSKTNQFEAEKIAEIIIAFDALYSANGMELNPAKDLGVITPFRAQIAQIRSELAKYNKGYEACTIDTVERYQGGARDIILLSLCVNTPYQLSTMVSLSDDEKVDRKLNVALTRARKHLVLVGNYDLLSRDTRYEKLIDYISKSKL